MYYVLNVMQKYNKIIRLQKIAMKNFCLFPYLY